MTNEPLTVGDAVRIFLEVRDVNGALADPTALELGVRLPDGSDATYVPTKDAVGKYHYDFGLEQSGTYRFRGKATGQNQSVVNGGIFVYPDAF